MKSARILVGVLALAAIVLAFVMQQKHHQELKREFALLRAELKEVVQQARAGRPASDAAVAIVERQEGERDELAKLREEISNLRVGTQELLKVAQTSTPAARESTGASANVADLIPAHALKNEGRATPEAAAQTLLWAAVSGDVDTLANGVVFTPSARTKADAWFAGLSDQTRAEYGSPEKVIALMIARDADKFGGVQILGQRELTPDNVGLRMRFSDTQGNTKDDNFVLHRSPDGWRLILPDATVEKFGKQLAGRK